MAFDAPGLANNSWAVIDRAGEVGVTGVQWDGGPASSIHGHGLRVLELSLGTLVYVPEWGSQPALVFQLLAEGYNMAHTVTVNFRFNGELLFPAADPQPEWL